MQQTLKKAALVASTLPAAIVASPAFALVRPNPNPQLFCLGIRLCCADQVLRHVLCDVRLQVDDRLNGDGTGLVFGVNDPALGWALAGVFGTVWAVWFTSQKDLGDFEVRAKYGHQLWAPCLSRAVCTQLSRSSRAFLRAQGAPLHAAL